MRYRTRNALHTAVYASGKTGFVAAGLLVCLSVPGTVFGWDSGYSTRQGGYDPQAYGDAWPPSAPPGYSNNPYAGGGGYGQQAWPPQTSSQAWPDNHHGNVAGRGNPWAISPSRGSWNGSPAAIPRPWGQLPQARDDVYRKRQEREAQRREQWARQYPATPPHGGYGAYPPAYPVYQPWGGYPDYGGYSGYGVHPYGGAFPGSGGGLWPFGSGYGNEPWGGFGNPWGAW